MYYLGVDCGGTHLRVGIVDDQGNVLVSSKNHSPLKAESDSFAEKVKEVFEQLIQEKHDLEIEGIGVGVPGPLTETGEILPSANLHNETPIEIRKQLESQFDKPIYIERDTNCALLGELWIGAARDFKNVVMLTLGTGVGGAIAIDGKLSEGTHKMAGEIGHIFLSVPELVDIAEAKEVPTCGLGHRGCFEALIKSTQDLEKIGLYLGIGLANVVDIFNPELIIIGGGMVRQGNFLPKAIAVMKEKGMFPLVDDVTVEYTKLGDLSGVIGAAKLVIDTI